MLSIKSKLYTYDKVVYFGTFIWGLKKVKINKNIYLLTN